MLLLLACGLVAKECVRPDDPGVGACVTSPTFVPSKGDDGGWKGIVTEVGTGEPDDCDGRWGSLGASAWWARVDDQLVAVATPGADAPLVAKGDPVEVAYAYAAMDFGPTTAAVEVRRDGVLLAWVGTAPAAAELGAPAELTFVRGAATCGGHEECGAWEGYELEVDAGGVHGTVARGATATIGEFVVTAAAHEHQLDSSGGTCPDWFVAEATVGVVSAVGTSGG